MELIDFLEMFPVKEYEFEIAEAIYCYASLNHDGQSSELYSILSTIDFKPGMIWNETRCLKENVVIECLDDDLCIALFDLIEGNKNENN